MTNSHDSSPSNRKWRQRFPMIDRRILLKRLSMGLAFSRVVPFAHSPAESKSPALTWDVHCHLASAAWETPEERIAELFKFADRLGIDRVMLSLGFPQAAIICGHAGGDWERGIRVVRATENVLIELAGFDPTSGVVEMAVRELGAERVLLGSDAGGRSFASQLAKVRGAEIPEAARKMILGDNLRRILTPIFRAKGYRM